MTSPSTPDPAPPPLRILGVEEYIQEFRPDPGHAGILRVIYPDDKRSPAFWAAALRISLAAVVSPGVPRSDGAGMNAQGMFESIRKFALTYLLGLTPAPVAMYGLNAAGDGIELMPSSKAAPRTVGSSTLTLTGAAQLLSTATPAMPTGATIAEIQAQGGDARSRTDGSTPTLTLGQIWFEGTPYLLSNTTDIAACQVIGPAGVVLDITWKTV